MPFKLASLFVEIGANAAPFERTIGLLKGQIASAGVGLASSANVMGRALVAAGVAGGAALAAGMYKSVRAASGLNETLSKVGVVFGDSAGKVTAQADEMAKRFGLPKKELLDAAAAFGLVGKAAGQSRAEAATMANTMAKLAADSSSFYNVPLDVALEKIRAGLVGESEPLRAFGVLLSEDAVKAEALAIGATRSSKALTEKAKVAARASLIVKGLKDATGDLERTESSTENQIRKLTGSLGNLAADVGQVLLPAFNRALTQVNSFGSFLGAAFDGNKGTIAAFADAMANALERVSSAVARLGAFFGPSFAAMGSAAADFGAFVGRNFEAVEEAISELPETLSALTGGWSKAFGPTAGEIIGKFAEQIESATEQVRKVLRNLPEYAEMARLELTGKLEDIKEAFRFAKDVAVEFGKAALDYWKPVTDAIKEGIEALKGYGAELQKILDKMAGQAKGLFGKLGGAAGGAAGLPVGGGMLGGGGLLGGLASNRIAEFFRPQAEEAGRFIRDAIGIAGDGMKEIVARARPPQFGANKAQVDLLKERIELKEKLRDLAGQFEGAGRLIGQGARSTADRLTAPFKAFFGGGAAGKDIAVAAAAGGKAPKAFNPEELSLADAARKLRGGKDDGKAIALAEKRTTYLERAAKSLDKIQQKIGNQIQARFG